GCAARRRPRAPRSVCQEPFVMSGSRRARDAGSAVMLAVACPAPTGCLSSPWPSFATKYPLQWAFVTVGTVGKAVGGGLHLAALRHSRPIPDFARATAASYARLGHVVDGKEAA